MDLVTDFIERYRKEYDFYEQSSRMVSQILDSSLQSAGIRAIVTSRAKNPARLEEKVRQRATKADYKSVDDIYYDIVDLAGVRVALYFPGEREEVGKIIRTLFLPVRDPKEFPNQAKPTYEKRFSGYWATHYRVRIPDGSLNESQKRYTEASVEIQVASVLMHAWSEVEHDLVYKPLQGALSGEEYAILDELNGLVLAGEISLERLQRAGEQRASTDGREYTNHYELAASILDLGRDYLSNVDLNEAIIGRVDLLYRLLKATNLNTPDQLTRFIKVLHNDFEKRPLSEQIIDHILAEDPSRYATYERIRLIEAPIDALADGSFRRKKSEAIGEFMAQWIEYEKRIRSLAGDSIVFFGGSIALLLKKLKVSDEIISSFMRLRHFRNQLVHGIEVPDIDTINAATAELNSLIIALPKHKKVKIKSSKKTKK